MKENVRSEDGWITRYGGDEFIVCIWGVTEGNALNIVEPLRTVIGSTPIVLEGDTIHITCSMGVQTIDRNIMGNENCRKIEGEVV